MPEKITQADKAYHVDDGAKRGPLTMFRVRFHPQEQRLLALCADRRVACWELQAEPREVKNRKEKYVVGELLCPHEIGWVRGFDLHPQGACVATGGSDRTLRLWPWQDGRPADKAAHQVVAHNGWVEAVAYSPAGDHLATAGADGAVKVWSANDLKLLHTLPAYPRFAADLLFTPDGRLLVSGGEDGRVLVWDAQTWAAVRTLEFGGANNQYGQTPRQSGVHRLAISRDSRWLAAAGGEKLDLFDLATGEQVASERVNMDVAFHPSADLLAGGESEVKCWSLEPGKLAPPAKEKNGKPQAAAAIPGKAIATIKRGDWSLGLRFSHDGKLLALGKADGVVELYHVA